MRQPRRKLLAPEFEASVAPRLRSLNRRLTNLERAPFKAENTTYIFETVVEQPLLEQFSPFSAPQQIVP